MARVVVIGGGISGLATAYAIRQRSTAAGLDLELTVLEAEERAGGKVKSAREDGYLLEWGPNGFLSSRKEVTELCSEVDVERRLLPGDDSAAKRYIYTKGGLRLLPMSPPGFLTTKILSFRGKLRVLREPWTKPAPEGFDETVAQFAERHLGREAVEQLVGPFVTGVFAGDPEQMSLKSSLPVMAALEKEGGGSLIRAMVRRMRAAKAAKRAQGAAAGGSAAKTETEKAAGAGRPGSPGGRPSRSEGLVGSTGRLTSFDDGMAVLTDALAGALGPALRTGQRVTSLHRESSRDDSPWVIEAAGAAQPFVADAVIVAAPAHAASEMLSALDDRLASMLAEIPYVPVNVVNLGFPASAAAAPLDGFGFLIPSKEGRRILGCVWTSSIFPSHAPGGRLSLRVMVGGASGAQWAELDDGDTLEMVREEVYGIMGISADPGFVRILRHERAIPQYVLGHGDRLDRIADRAGKLPGLFVTGNAYRGVSLPDCVRNGSAVAEQVVAFLSE